MTGKDRKNIADQEALATKLKTDIASLDWKVQRHLEQRELLAAGKIEATSLTEEQYLVLLEEKQRLRNLVS